MSGCFRSIKGAKKRTMIFSIIETCKKRNLNVLISLQKNISKRNDNNFLRHFARHIIPSLLLNVTNPMESFYLFLLVPVLFLNHFEDLSKYHFC